LQGPTFCWRFGLILAYVPLPPPIALGVALSNSDKRNFLYSRRLAFFFESDKRTGQSLARLTSLLTVLDARAKKLLLGVVRYVHTDYSADHVVEELDRLADTDPAATAEILERMFETSTPNFDMDDNIEKLLRTLYDKGHYTEVLRCVEMLRKTLPGMLELVWPFLRIAPLSPSLKSRTSSQKWGSQCELKPMRK
jgi:hypothetical protein